MIARAGLFATVTGATCEDAFVAWAPMFHMASTDQSLITLMLGGRVVVCDGLDLDAITAAPWDGAPHNANNPDAEVRRWLFGPLGMAQVLGDRSVLVAAGAGLSLEGVAAAQLTQCTRRSSTRRRSCSRTR